jgi:IrrE N-terminal-like domain
LSGRELSFPERRARAAAKEVLERYAIEESKHLVLEGLAADLGVTVVRGELAGAVARLARVGDHARIRVATRVTNAGRQRFSVAHELGHFVLKHDGSALAGCQERSMVDYKGESKESEANIFAVELLLPEKLVRRRCDVLPVDLRPVRKLADEFETSVTATAIRFIEFSPERCALVYSEKGRVRWTRKSESFWFRLIGLGQPLEPASLAIDFFRKGAVPEEPEDVRGDAWIESSSGRAPEVVEHSMAIPSLGAVVSLLWVPS